MTGETNCNNPLRLLHDGERISIIGRKIKQPENHLIILEANSTGDLPPPHHQHRLSARAAAMRAKRWSTTASKGKIVSRPMQKHLVAQGLNALSNCRYNAIQKTFRPL
jgi:hypothetical protein